MSDNKAASKAAVQKAARRVAQRLTEAFQPRRTEVTAAISNVQHDIAGRTTVAFGSVGGVSGQRILISHGQDVAAGDVWRVANEGTPAAPRWVAIQKLRASPYNVEIDPNVILPTPTGLQVIPGVYQLVPGSGWRAYLRCSWLGIGEQYGQMGYELQYCTNDFETITQVLVTDRHPTTLLDGAVDASQTALPRDPDAAGWQDDFPSFGRIRLQGEKVDYVTVTTGPGDSGSGTGSLNALTDATKSWTAGAWINYLLTDANGDAFLITGNTSTVLTVSGTPATGTYSIKPCFANCTRGAGGTTPAAHPDNTGIGSLSVGLTLAELQPETDYQVRVRAKSASGALSAWTAWVSAQTLGDEIPPSVPTGMGYLPTAINQIELFWNRNPDGDMSHYQVALSITSSPFTPVAGYPKEIVGTRCRVHWLWGTACYWRIRAVDQQNNASAYCDVQVATPMLPDPPSLRNPGLEDGVASPDYWSLVSAGRVTTSWGTCVSAKTGLSTKTGKIVVTDGMFGGDIVDALISAPFAIDRFQAYSVGCNALRKAAADNVFHFVVFQYRDAGGTPATTPKVEVGDISFMGIDAFIFQSFDFTVSPWDDDVTHIAVGISVEHAWTYEQEVHFDDFAIIPRQVVSFPEDEGQVDQDLGSYVHTTLPKVIKAQHVFDPDEVQAPFALGLNARGQVVEGLVADRLNVVYDDEAPASPADGMLWLVAPSG